MIKLGSTALNPALDAEVLLWTGKGGSRGENSMVGVVWKKGPNSEAVWGQRASRPGGWFAAAGLGSAGAAAAELRSRSGERANLASATSAAAATGANLAPSTAAAAASHIASKARRFYRVLQYTAALFASFRRDKVHIIFSFKLPPFYTGFEFEFGFCDNLSLTEQVEAK